MFGVLLQGARGLE